MNKSYYYEVVEHLNEEDNFEVMSCPPYYRGQSPSLT